MTRLPKPQAIVSFIGGYCLGDKGQTGVGRCWGRTSRWEEGEWTPWVSLFLLWMRREAPYCVYKEERWASPYGRQEEGREVRRQDMENSWKITNWGKLGLNVEERAQRAWMNGRAGQYSGARETLRVTSPICGAQVCLGILSGRWWSSLVEHWR